MLILPTVHWWQAVNKAKLRRGKLYEGGCEITSLPVRALKRRDSFWRCSICVFRGMVDCSCVYICNDELFLDRRFHQSLHIRIGDCTATCTSSALLLPPSPLDVTIAQSPPPPLHLSSALGSVRTQHLLGCCPALTANWPSFRSAEWSPFTCQRPRLMWGSWVFVSLGRGCLLVA